MFSFSPWFQAIIRIFSYGDTLVWLQAITNQSTSTPRPSVIRLSANDCFTENMRGTGMGRFFAVQRRYAAARRDAAMRESRIGQKLTVALIVESLVPVSKQTLITANRWVVAAPNRPRTAFPAVRDCQMLYRQVRLVRVQQQRRRPSWF